MSRMNSITTLPSYRFKNDLDMSPPLLLHGLTDILPWSFHGKMYTHIVRLRICVTYKMFCTRHLRMGVFDTASAVSLYWIILILRRNYSKPNMRPVITSLFGARAIGMCFEIDLFCKLSVIHARRNNRWTKLVYYYQKHYVDIYLK
jgi:hypothetical protein